ncbi:MAG: isocitrate/isopropylmalate dehydrogenase family protein [Candidatus Odinarchaeota archaeon]
MAHAYKIQVLPGDGIGPEVIDEARKVLTTVATGIPGLNLSFHEFPCGGKYYLETGCEWPGEAEVFARQEADAILLGAVGWEKSPGEPVRREDGQMAGAAVVLGQRRELQLYANVRPVKLYPGIPTPLAGKQPEDIDFVIIRENTEGLYSGIGKHYQEDTAEELAIDVRPISRIGAERVIRYAFNLAQKRRQGAPRDGKRRVTCVDKSNVLLGDQLFRRVFGECARNFPQLEPDYAYIDAWTMWCLRQPEYYNVVVTPNLYGDIITDLGAAIQGGMGVAAGGNIGDIQAMFEPIHGSAPRHAGKRRANPTAAILAGKMLLEWLAERRKDQNALRAATVIEQAVVDVLKEGRVRTYDLCVGPYSQLKPSTTKQVGTAIRKRIQQLIVEK